MKKDDYIIISFDEDLKCTVLKKMQAKMKLMKLNSMTAIDIENTIYVLNGKVLSEKEKIFYECNRIKRFIKANSEILKNRSYKELYRRLAILLLRLCDEKIDLSNTETIIDLKKEILEIEIHLGMKLGLYSVVDGLLDDLNNKYIIKKEY